MRITEVFVVPLTGGTVDGGWPQGHEPQENLHTLVEVRTDAGLSGWGSCFTSGTLVAGAVQLLWPLLRGESAVEPERVSETLRQSTFWQGRGGSVEHAISGLDVALTNWDEQKGDDDSRWVTVEVRHVSGTCQPSAPWTLTLSGNQ